MVVDLPTHSHLFTEQDGVEGGYGDVVANMPNQDAEVIMIVIADLPTQLASFHGEPANLDFVLSILKTTVSRCSKHVLHSYPHLFTW